VIREYWWTVIVAKKDIRFDSCRKTLGDELAGKRSPSFIPIDANNGRHTFQGTLLEQDSRLVQDDDPIDDGFPVDPVRR
jgi:hypothetical protein